MSKPAFTKSASGRIKAVFSKRKRTTPGMSRVIGVTGDRLLSLIGAETVDEIRDRVRAEEIKKL